MPEMKIDLDGADGAWKELVDRERVEWLAPNVLHAASLLGGTTNGERNCAFLVVREDGSSVVIETTAALVIALGTPALLEGVSPPARIWAPGEDPFTLKAVRRKVLGP